MTMDNKNGEFAAETSAAAITVHTKAGGSFGPD